MHYKNGREAKVGDRVVGHCYNTKGLVAGTVLSITPGQDACSVKVGFLETTPFQGSANGWGLCCVQGTEQHGSAGPLAMTFYREDYTHCANLLHADDALGS